jgi:hypothetical protein
MATSGWDGFVNAFRDWPHTALNATIELQAVDRAWIRAIHSLRDVYRRLGVPESDWAVSAGPDRPRTSKEPDIATLRRFFIAAGDNVQFYWSAGNRDELVGNIDRLGRY